MPPPGPDDQPNGTLSSTPGAIRLNAWQHVAGNVVGGRGHEHAEIGVEEVDGHGLGAGEA